MRSLSSPEVSALLTGVPWYRVEMKRPTDVAWTNLSASYGGDWALGVRTDAESPDQPVGRFSVTLLKAADGYSTAPGISASPLNRDGSDAYAPLVYPGNWIRVYAVKLPAGTTPSSGDLRLWLEGRVRTSGWPTDVVASCVTLDQILEDTQIEEEEIRGEPDPGTPIEEEIQGLLDRWMGDGVVPLRVVGTPDWGVGEYTPSGSLGAQIRSLVQEQGWDIRYLWSDSDNAYRYTLYLPPRDKTTVDLSITRADILSVPDLKVSSENVRNAFTGTAIAADGSLLTATDQDDVSILQFGRLWGKIAEGVTSSIKTLLQLTTLLGYAKSDLSQPPVEKKIQIPFLPWLVLHDRIAIEADGQNFDFDGEYAVVGVSHAAEAGADPYTEVDLRAGSPVGMFYAWKARKRANVDYSGAVIREFRVLEEDATTITLTWTPDSLVSEEWGAYVVFDTPVSGDPWETVKATVAPLTDGTHTLVVPKPAEDQVVYVQVEARYTDPASGLLRVGNMWRREITPENRQPPLVELDDIETATTGTQWWKTQERGIPVVLVEVQTQIGTQPISSWGSPARGPGDASAVRGGTLGAGEYEHDVLLDASRFSWIFPRLTPATGEIISLGPFGFDRNKLPNLIDVTPDGQTIKAIADSDTESLKAEKISGGGSAWTGAHVDGQNFTWSVPVGAGETWIVRVTAYSEGAADVDGSTPLDFRDVTVLGTGVTPPGEPGGEPGWVTVSATAPAAGSDVVSIVADASSAPGGYTAKLYFRDPDLDPDFTEVDNADLSPDMTLTTSSTPFLWSSGVTRAAGSGPTQRWEIKAEILDGSANVVASETRTVSYRYTL